MKNLLLLAFLFPAAAIGQTTTAPAFTGSWTGDISNLSTGSTIWDVKIDITGSKTAALSIYNDSTSSYVPFLTDPRFKDYKNTASFTSSGNLTTLTLWQTGTGSGCQTNYNMVYNADKNWFSVAWSCLCYVTDDDGVTSTTMSNGSGTLTKGLSRSFLTSGISVGGKSKSNLEITGVESNGSYTKVSVKVSNPGYEAYTGTFHQAGSDKAFYLTDISRTKTYALKYATYKLPVNFTLQRYDETFTIDLFFEPVPTDMTVFNMIEGVTQTEGSWNFYDVTLK